MKKRPKKHPITGKPFNYQRICKTCTHFIDRTRTLRGTKYRVTLCALDPDKRNLAETDSGTSWAAMPACSQHRHN